MTLRNRNWASPVQEALEARTKCPAVIFIYKDGGWFKESLFSRRHDSQIGLALSSQFGLNIVFRADGFPSMREKARS